MNKPPSSYPYSYSNSYSPLYSSSFSLNSYYSYSYSSFYKDNNGLLIPIFIFLFDECLTGNYIS